jgi:tetratricopeptide (TPR) repeat protein
VTDPKNPEQEPDATVELDAATVIEEVPSTADAPAARPAPAGLRPPVPRAPPRAPLPRAEVEGRPLRPPPLRAPPPHPSTAAPPPSRGSSSSVAAIPTAGAPSLRGGRLNTPATGRPIVRPTSVRLPVPPSPAPVGDEVVEALVEAVPVTRSEAPEVDLSDDEIVALSVPAPPLPDVEREAIAPGEPVEPVAYAPIAPAPELAHSLDEPREPDAEVTGAIRPSVMQPIPLSVEIDAVPQPSMRPPPAPAPTPLDEVAFAARIDALAEAPLTLGGLDELSPEDDLDAAFRSIELDEQNDPEFVQRLTAAPALADGLPGELVEGLSIVETREMPMPVAAPAPDESNVLLSFDDVFGVSHPPVLPAPPSAEDLELSLASGDPSVVPEILQSMHAPFVPSDAPVEVVPDRRPSDILFEAHLSAEPPPIDEPSVEAPVASAPDEQSPNVEPPIEESFADFDAELAAPHPAAHPPIAPFRLDVEPLSDAPAAVIEFDEGPTISSDSDAPESVEIEGETDDVVLDELGMEGVDAPDVGVEAELFVEGGEEVEIDVPPADRGAMLAASVTSRNLSDDDTDAHFAVEPRAEALARAALLVEEADHAAPAQAAEMLSLAADLVEGIAGDRARAKELATRAHALAPTLAAPIRVLRRVEIAEGNAAAALALCEAELAGPLDDAERTENLMLAGELAARIDGADAARLWSEAAAAGGVTGALARILAAGVTRDRGALGEALGVFAAQTGGVLAASVDVARARMMEGAEDQAAILAIRDAVRRDPSDASAWLAMARIGLAQSNAGFFREGMSGLARAGDAESASVLVADALRRALDSVLGDPVASGTAADAGVAGWLVAHALRDAGADPTSQAAFGLTHATVDGRGPWAAWAGDAAGGDAGRYLALRKVLSQRSDEGMASAGAAFVGGDGAGAVEAGLRARGASVDATEADALGIAGGATGSAVRAALVAATSGIDAAEAVADAAGESVWHRVARVESLARTGRRDEARAAFAALADEGAPPGATAYGLRATALLGADTDMVVAALRREAKAARDPRRAAGQSFLAASLAASAGVPDGGADAVLAATGLPGDLAAAEIAALHALRGDAVPTSGADLLDAAAAGEGAAARMAAVRAALRRASIDADAAAEAVWRSWNRNPADAALGALVLRTPSRTTEHTVAVARALADAAWAAGRERVEGAVGAGTFLALAHEQAGRYADASQALARTRTFALNDRALAAAEERLWLRAGMFTETTERAFDRLNAAATDDERIAAYERLAEIDRFWRNQFASAVLSLQEIVSLAPGHLPTLHALLRFFIEEGRQGEATEVCLRLAEHAHDPNDALAFAHLGARLASAQADGDPAAGQRFHAAVFARGFTDLRLLNGLDADARRDGDHGRFAAVQERLAELTTDPSARSVYLSRAAESAEALGDHGRALPLHMRAVDALPDSVRARWGAAWSLVRAGEPSNAAEMFEAAGRYAASPEAGAWSWSQAAALWRGAVGERTRALAALRELLERDPTSREAFDEALGILRDAGDSTGELELLERYGRTSITAEAPDEQAQMHARAATLAEAQGDGGRAIAQWRSVLTVRPEDQPALRALARLARAAGEWNVSADAMIRLAKITTDTAERVELLFGLGEVLDDHIGDPKRAEIAWRRVLSLAPRDARTLTRLMDVYRRAGDTPREADTLQSLVALAAPGPERIDGLLRLASLAELSLNDAERAHAALEAARRDSPGDLKVLRALRGFHARNGDMDAFVAIADRATVDVRRAADLNPRDLPILERLSEMLEVRGHDDASRIAAAVAVALGSRNDRARALAYDGTVKGIGEAALTPDALALLAPPAVSVALREVLGRSAAVLELVTPFDPKAFGAERLGARPHPLRDEIARQAEVLGLSPVEVYVAASVPSVCAPVGRAPAAVLVPASIELTPGTRFAVRRALLLMALSLTVPVRLGGRDLALVLGALLRQFEPMYRPDGVDARELVELAARITRAMPRDLHAEIEPFAEEILRSGVKDAETIRAGALELGDRVALLATGDVAGGIALLSPPDTAPIEAVEVVPAVGRLVRVALSDRFMEARRIAGADLAASQ